MASTPARFRFVDSRWAQANFSNDAFEKGDLPMECRLCPGSLLFRPAAVEEHVRGKKHLSAAERHNKATRLSARELGKDETSSDEEEAPDSESDLDLEEDPSRPVRDINAGSLARRAWRVMRIPSSSISKKEKSYETSAEGLDRLQTQAAALEKVLKAGVKDAAKEAKGPNRAVRRAALREAYALAHPKQAKEARGKKRLRPGKAQRAELKEKVSGAQGERGGEGRGGKGEEKKGVEKKGVVKGAGAAVQKETKKMARAANKKR
ncbi:hypothetical protein H632_c1159p0 [Helicosporidium sp. ATCC 50920]|nr:hypothetical protein H632_c1159p0 [Helicosporidium sp. ATCC 50920]|eukprot:KDD74648.1 hypothetical protein H632_c1159p0 [Helicosporidium sp. ATCC 50920]